MKNKTPTTLYHCKVTTNVPIKHLLNQHSITQFQFRYMCLNSLKTHKRFRYQLHNTTDTEFGKEAFKPIKNTYNAKNTCVLSLIVFYERTKVIMFKVVGYITYGLQYSYVFLDQFCLNQDKLSKYNKNIKNRI